MVDKIVESRIRTDKMSMNEIVRLQREHNRFLPTPKQERSFEHDHTIFEFLNLMLLDAPSPVFLVFEQPNGDYLCNTQRLIRLIDFISSELFERYSPSAQRKVLSYRITFSVLEKASELSEDDKSMISKYYF